MSIYNKIYWGEGTVIYGRVLGPSKKKKNFFSISQFFEILSQFLVMSFFFHIFLLGPNTLPYLYSSVVISLIYLCRSVCVTR